jgi:tRNA dimethylallyltransferase
MALGVSSASPAFQAIGYRQLAAHLEGRSSFDEAVAETIKATRHFAKRQETWFRRDERIRWFDARDIDSVRSEVRTWLANPGVGARA